MAIYQTPGVYVEEISTFPPSVAQVSTAIPAFIGYTGKNPRQVARIDTLLEYENLFGKAKPRGFTAKLDAQGKPAIAFSNVEEKDFLMYYGLSLYFRNGGGSCYIVSVGTHEVDQFDKNHFIWGLEQLEMEDEPTLIVLLDAVNLSRLEYYDLCKQALAQCQKLGDRFLIADIPAGDINSFRDNIGTSNLMYGTAYHPYLQSLLNYAYDEAGISIEDGAATTATSTSAEAQSVKATTATQLKTTQTALYNQIKALMDSQRVTLPPSPAIAGIYARVDRERGVWKAPANVGIASVIGPVSKITNQDQENLNIDPTAGKSINAIRAFPGKGTLIWGARTLAGNDNEWRYIPVRRLFIMIEESARKATAFAVFEPNDATTWLKVKAMLESYLYGLWEQGALAGSKPESAYFANVGLGKTMTNQDILEGRMIIEIGIAAVRPAEFIILRFSHKMQEA